MERSPPQRTPGVIAPPASTRWRTLGSFGIAFLFTLWVASLQSDKTFFADSGEYWRMGERFVREGHFSFLNFDSIIRGYSLPLIYRELQFLTDPFGWTPGFTVKVFNSAQFALIGAVLGPMLAELAWPGRRWGLWRRLALTGLLIVFWNGYLAFPLSDFPGVVALLMTIVAAGNPRNPSRMLLAGLSCGLTINIRPGYLLLMPLLLLLVLAGWFHRSGDERVTFIRGMLCAALLVLGFVIVSAPQSLSASRNAHTASFIPGAAVGLLSQQFADGLTHDRYDSFEGPPMARVLYINDAPGRRLLAGQAGHPIDGWSSYLGLIANHPLTMGGVLVRHVLNGLDARYATPYVERVDGGGHLPLRILGYLLVFLALVRLPWPAARRRLGPTRWRYLLVLLLSGATTLASHMEVRYVLALYLLLYILLLAPGWPSLGSSSASGAGRLKVPAAILAGGLLFTALVVHVANVGHSQMRY